MDTLQERIEDLEVERDYWVSEIESLENQLKTITLNFGEYEDEYDDYLNQEGVVEVKEFRYIPADVVKSCSPEDYNAGLKRFVEERYPASNSVDYIETQKQIEQGKERLEQIKKDLAEAMKEAGDVGNEN